MLCYQGVILFEEVQNIGEKSKNKSETLEVTASLQCLRHFTDYSCQKEKNKTKSSR